eukprot:scaffold22199_cov21-Tisochrysis_lutea.AAC.2
MGIKQDRHFDPRISSRLVVVQQIGSQGLTPPPKRLVNTHDVLCPCSCFPQMEPDAPHAPDGSASSQRRCSPGACAHAACFPCNLNLKIKKLTHPVLLMDLNPAKEGLTYEQHLTCLKAGPL